jgi:hypothetical protein
MLLTSEPCCGSSENQKTAAVDWNGPAPAVGTEKNDAESRNKAEATHDSPPSWCTALKKSEWWLVIIAALTGIAIASQAREMARTTGIMKNQWATMQGQLTQMIASGKQTDDLIKETISQTKNMDGQLEQMRTQTRLSIRPFVGLDEGPEAIQTTALLIDESGNARLTYIIRAKNYSNVPASNVWAHANLVVADNMMTVYEWHEYACDDAVIGKPDIGLTLFPGRDRVFSSMPAIAKIIKKHEGSRLQAWLVGCIGYRDQFGYLYRTKFISMFYDATGKVAVFDPPKQSTSIIGRFVPSGGAIDAGQVPKYNYDMAAIAKQQKQNHTD